MNQISGLQYMEGISGVLNYINQIFTLFNEVDKARPKILLDVRK